MAQNLSIQEVNKLVSYHKKIKESIKGVDYRNDSFPKAKN